MKNLPLISDTEIELSVVAGQIAKEAIVNNNFDKDKFGKYYGGGFGRADLTLGYQFVTACSDYAVTEIANSKSAKEVAKNFMNAISHVCESEFAYGLDYFKAKIASYKIEGLETPEAFQELIKEAIKGTPLESNQIAKQVTQENKEAVLDKISALKENTNNVSNDYKLK